MKTLNREQANNLLRINIALSGTTMVKIYASFIISGGIIAL